MVVVILSKPSTYHLHVTLAHVPTVRGGAKSGHRSPPHRLYAQSLCLGDQWGPAPTHATVTGTLLLEDPGEIKYYQGDKENNNNKNSNNNNKKRKQKNKIAPYSKVARSIQLPDSSKDTQLDGYPTHSWLGKLLCMCGHTHLTHLACMKTTDTSSH